LRDQVTVEAKLSRPAYAYLIAFRPDGVAELCVPDREDVPPPLVDQPRYPSKVSTGRRQCCGLPTPSSKGEQVDAVGALGIVVQKR
jgi:hypothetical protein